MTLDTEPTIRLPVVDVPSAVITTDLHIARARTSTARRARIQRRWDLLAQVLSYLLFGGTLGLLIGICGALFALALSMADHDHDGAVPAPDSTTSTAAALTLPSMPPTAYPLLGGVAAAPSTTRPAATRATQRPTSTAQATASAQAPTPTTAATQPATTAPPPATEPATTTSTVATTTAPPPPPPSESTSPTSTAAPPASA